MSSETMFILPKYLMMASGLWRQGMPQFNHHLNTAYKIYSCVCQSMYMGVTLSLTVEFLRMCGTDMDKALENLSKTLYSVLLVTKSFGCQTEGIVNLIYNSIKEEQQIKSKAEENIRRIYQKDILYSNRLAKLILCASLAIMCHLTMTSVWDAYLAPDSDIGLNHVKFPLQLAYPFDKYKYQNVAFALQMYSIMWTSLVTSGVFTFYTSFMIFLVAQFKVLQFEMKHSCDVIEKVDDELRRIIIKHQKLIAAIDTFNKSNMWMFFIEYSITSILLALTVIQILSGRKPVFHFMYFWIIYAQFFTSCWNANEFSVQSTALAHALYNSDWVPQRNSTKKVIHIMLMRCQRQVSLYIAPLVPLEAHAALSRIKLVYSYVSLMSSRLDGSNKQI